MEFTPRVKQILLVLLDSEEVLSVKKLSEQVGVSKRTVQRELDYVGYVLKKYQLQLCSKTGAGIWLEGEVDGRKKLREDLECQTDERYVDKEERCRNLMLELLKDQVPKKLYYYANLFSVSEATISKDIDRVEPWFERFHLEIIRKQGYGVLLSGKESDYRVAVREFITKYMDTPVLSQLYDEAEVAVTRKIGAKSIQNSYKLLNEDILRRVGICMGSFPDGKIQHLTEDSYVGLVIHITIAMERVMEGEIIEQNEELKAKLQFDEDWELATMIVQSLEKEFEVEMPDIEIVYICLHIKGAKLQKADIESGNKELREFVEKLIVIYDEQLAVELGADEELIHGLTAHLQPTLVRLRNGMVIDNPHLTEIRESYPEIYENCLRVGAVIGEKAGCCVPDEEIGFLAIHFGAALVRLEEQREKRRVVNVGLVCASGIGISRLMASRLQKYLKARVRIATYGKEDLKPFVLEQNDFFVTSMNLEDLDAEVLQVNPLLPEEDLLRVEEVVERYAAAAKETNSNDDFTKQVERVNRLAGGIKDLLENFRCIEVPEVMSFDGILEQAMKSITPYRENQRRLVEDIKSREQIATQIVPELEIALFHARTHGVFQVGFYVVIPQNHEVFTDTYMQSAKAAIIMLMPEDENKEESSHILGYLSESLVEDAEFLDVIQSGRESEIKNQLSRLLKRYFNQYLDTF